MPDKTKISQAEFVAACCTVAAVLANSWWQESRTPGESVKRPQAATSAAMDCLAAAKYCGFGRTRFRELVAAGVFPPPVTIEGRKRWLAKDLDVALGRMAREQQRRK